MGNQRLPSLTSWHAAAPFICLHVFLKSEFRILLNQRRWIKRIRFPPRFLPAARPPSSLSRRRLLVHRHSSRDGKRGSLALHELSREKGGDNRNRPHPVCLVGRAEEFRWLSAHSSGGSRANNSSSAGGLTRGGEGRQSQQLVSQSCLPGIKDVPGPRLTGEIISYSWQSL